MSAPAVDPSPDVLVRRLPRPVAYESVWRAMRAFTDARDADTPDEIWLVEHQPVFTLGQAGKPEHVLNPGDIPVVPIDRGGQVTYHGPGQLVAYVMVDLKRRKLGVRALVTVLEQSVVALLGEHGVESAARADAPGVYVGEKKIAALGLRVRNGRSYHGLALNVAMDLEPFLRINPCGYPGMEVIQTSTLGVAADWEQLSTELVGQLTAQLGYNRALDAPQPELPSQAV